MYKHIKIKPRICVLFIMCLTWTVNANLLKRNIIVIGWMNRRRFCLQKGGSQEHISLITIMFCFDEFAFTIKHNIYSTQILGLFWYVCILWLAISTHVYIAKNVAYFPLNFGSVFSDCIVFYADTQTNCDTGQWRNAKLQSIMHAY